MRTDVPEDSVVATRDIVMAAGTRYRTALHADSPSMMSLASSTMAQQPEPHAYPVPYQPVAPASMPTGARFVLHELWEGAVEEVFDSYFVAQVVSRTNNTAEHAEIYKEEVSREDLPLLREGAIFYWAIGYEDSSSGQRTRSSLIRFRRLPSVSPLGNEVWLESVKQRWLRST